jgi:hypothetical protein
LRKVSIEITFDKKMPDRRRTRIIELRKTEQEEQRFDAGAAGVADGADSMDGVSPLERDGAEPGEAQPHRSQSN